MQIGSSNPLTYIAGNMPALTGRAGESDAATSREADNAARAGATADPIAPLQDSTVARENAGVILTLQSDQALARNAQALVYSKARPVVANADADNERRALQHTDAQQRSATSVSQLSVDSNGVLLAIPASRAEVRAQEFVHHAVNTMRAYADEQDRLKHMAKTDAASPSAQGAALIPRSLAEVHKLAARFKLFA
jgi:hypothetical protein